VGARRIDVAKYKVIRTWYVEAKKAVEAVEKTREFNHDRVEAFRLPHSRYMREFDSDAERTKPR
jgi:hypothetical protein